MKAEARHTLGKKLKWNDEERSGEDDEGRALADALGPTLIPNKPLDQELKDAFSMLPAATSTWSS